MMTDLVIKRQNHHGDCKVYCVILTRSSIRKPSQLKIIPEKSKPNHLKCIYKIASRASHYYR